MNASDEFYKSLLASTKNKRKLRNIDILWSVLRRQKERGSNDYSITTIGKMSSEKGGIKAQSILNASGKDYKRLIRTFAEEVNGNIKRVKGEKTSESTVMLDSIEDLTLRSRLQFILAENKSLKNQNQILSNSLKKASFKIDDHAPETVETSKKITTNYELSPLEIKSIEDFISPENLVSEGLQLDEYGALIKDNGRRIAGIGFVSGLRKIINSQK